MENFPPFLVAFNVCAATFPRFASAVAMVWVVARVMYQLGYQRVGPKGRSRGSTLSGIAALTLVTPFCLTFLMVARRWNLRPRYRVLEVHVMEGLPCAENLVSDV